MPGNNNDGQRQRSQFVQINFFDSELQNRINAAAKSKLNTSTMLAFQDMMHEIIPFVEYFKTMADMHVENCQSSSDTINGDIRMIFKAENTPDSRRYNAPTAAEIDVFIVGGDGDRRSETEPTNPDIVVRLKEDENTLSHIKETNQFCDPLQYVLMFPQAFLDGVVRLFLSLQTSMT